MRKKLLDLFKKDFPQNLIFRKPVMGSIAVFAFIWLFAWLYRPLGTHAGSFLSYGLTMAAYSAGSALIVFGVAQFGNIYLFQKKNINWNIMYEAGAIVVTLFLMGIATYFIAFVIEPPSDRWNFSTFFDSIKRTALIGMIPFLAVSAINLRFWLIGSKIVYSTSVDLNTPDISNNENPIRIISQLKKEELDFLPNQFIYAESDGNYVVFHVDRNGKMEKELIRNSMNGIEDQLSKIPWFFRTHRAFIINLKKVTSAKGNTLGYRVNLTGIKAEVPVARNKTRQFMKLLEEFKSESSSL
jgi:hypothetical protein